MASIKQCYGRLVLGTLLLLQLRRGGVSMLLLGRATKWRHAANGSGGCRNNINEPPMGVFYIKAPPQNPGGVR